MNRTLHNKSEFPGQKLLLSNGTLCTLQNSKNERLHNIQEVNKYTENADE